MCGGNWAWTDDGGSTRAGKRAAERDVLGRLLPVATVEDVLRGEVWAVRDPSRRTSERQKDLADIARLLEVRPNLREMVRAEILDRQR
ncbi:MAG: hypothetical protein FJ033_12610 [Chloroflexi bacterium]|nr:hypothetical protein [Chloroflexota bacterium]